MHSFKKIELEDKELFDEFFKGDLENSEANFTNLYMWKDYYDTRFTLDNGFLVIINTSPNGHYHCYMPYGKGDLKKCLLNLYDYCKSEGQALRITNASHDQLSVLKEAFPNAEIEENTSFNDYVYSVKDLITLSGKKLHSKRNHLNRFKSEYEGYVYRSIREDDFEKCLDLAARLMLKDRDETNFSYVNELNSIKTAFDNFDLFSLKGGLIEIDGDIKAFTVGEAHTENCALIHIEKADVSYNGIYAAINNEFVKNQWSEFEFVNREEDMGIEGLRKAKESYRSHHQVVKYKCTVM